MRDAMERGARVTALGAGGDGFDDRLHAEGYAFIPVPLSRSGVAPAADLGLLAALFRLFRGLRPTIVHSFTIKPAIYATIAAWLARVPVRVVTITGLGHAFTTGRRPLRLLVELLYRIALARADAVIFQNSDDRELFVTRRLVDGRRTRMVPGSGVDIRRFAPVPLPSANGGMLSFVMVARLLREKGLAEYLEAAERVARLRPGVRFTLVGGADTRNPSSLTATELAKLKGFAAVTWVGEVDDVRPYIAAADVVVLPSYREGLPRSLLEGAAMARALIATDVPGCREVVESGYNGLLVPARNADALADAMLELVDNPRAVVGMGERGRQRVMDRYSDRAVSDQVLAIYRELLSEKGCDAQATAVPGTERAQHGVRRRLRRARRASRIRQDPA